MISLFSLDVGCLFAFTVRGRRGESTAILAALNVLNTHDGR